MVKTPFGRIKNLDSKIGYSLFKGMEKSEDALKALRQLDLNKGNELIDETHMELGDSDDSTYKAIEEAQSFAVGIETEKQACIAKGERLTDEMSDVIDSHFVDDGQDEGLEQALADIMAKGK